MTRARLSRSRAIAALALGAALMASVRAAASPTFPEELQRQLDMPCVPTCTLCHRDSNGGVGTAVQPFGAVMKNHGLALKRPDLIARSLEDVEAQSIDSDGDGVIDVDELREGRNPNETGAGLLCATYGCGAHLAPRANAKGDAASTGLLTLLVIGAFNRRRRARIKQRAGPS